MISGMDARLGHDAPPLDGPVLDESEANFADDADIGLYEPEPTEAKRQKPRIQSTDENLPMHTAAAWSAIKLANNPPQLFRFGGRPARITLGDEGVPTIGLMDLHSMRSTVASVAEWFKYFYCPRPRSGT